MDTKTFLTRVSASLDDLVVSLWKPDPLGKSKNGIFWNRGSFATLDDAVAAIQLWDTDPDWTVYYAVGRMANHAHTKPDGSTGYYRQQQHATWFKTICLDMDIGGKYATQKEGHTAMVAAVKAIGLPDPMVVSSGRGIHYYWPLTEAIPKQHWEKASIALRLALADQQVEIDNSKIHDASMVLRPVGTSHKKQVPWKLVEVKSDCPDYDIADIVTPLKPWLGKAVQTTKKKSTKPSAIADAVLKNCNLDIRVLGQKCNQLKALLASGGEFDAAGNAVLEPLWRASLGIAAYATDQEEAMMLLCASHPEFDHDANMQKMSMWTAAPTSCGEFAKHCTTGCDGCVYKGVASPASINEEPASLPTTPTATAVTAQAATITAPAVKKLPGDYYVSNGHICLDADKEVKDKDADGKVTVKLVKSKQVVCPYEIHVLAMYTDLMQVESTATIAVHYPFEGWKEHEMPMAVVGSLGKEFTNYLVNKQIILPTENLVQTTRTYLMNYLKHVQSQIPSGIDFKRFGWQEDGSFLCGDTLIGSPTANTLRRLKGTAASYSDKIRKKGDRTVWADATAYCDMPEAEYLGVGILTACMGALGNAAGAATPLISFHSTETGTGKTLALAIGSSTFMNPDPKLMFQPSDTDNAFYNALGTLGDLSGAMDEVTLMHDDKRAVDMAYIVSMGREKMTLTKDRDARPFEVWGAPMRLSTNKSMYEMYDGNMDRNDPVRMRTLEFKMDSRKFVNNYGTHLYHTIMDNYGFAMPELADEIFKRGGPKGVWHEYVVKFDKDIKFIFDSQERFFRNSIITCYAVGDIGRKIGLFKFDIERIIHFMVNRVLHLRRTAVTNRTDAFDTIGQYMQEFNHELVVSRELSGSKDPKIQFPVPENISIRLEILHDATNPTLPGSRLVLNKIALRNWLKRGHDSIERLTEELQDMGALIESNARVTMYKGCQRQNPGQAFCLSIDLTHPRMAVTLNGGKPIPVPMTDAAAAILQPNLSDATAA